MSLLSDDIPFNLPKSPVPFGDSAYLSKYDQ